MLNTLLFIGNEVVSWIVTNVPVTGVIVVVAWLTWTIRGAVSRFEKEIVLVNNRIEKVELRVGALETRIEKLEETFEKRFEKLEEKFDNLSEKFDKVLEELRNNRR